MTDEEQPGIVPADAVVTKGKVTVKIADIERYQARMELVNQRQKESIDRLLSQIKELNERNRQDAGEIARVTGLLVQAEEGARQLQVQLDRAVEERQVAIDAVKGVQLFLNDRVKEFTTDGDSITNAQAVWDRHADLLPAPDEAELALSAIEATLPIVPGADVIHGEVRPASSWSASDDESSGRHASLT